MKGCKVKNIKHQSGSAHLIIIVALLLALIGALGFVFWQNFMQPKETTTQTNSVIKSTTKDKTEQISQSELETIVKDELSILNGKTDLDQITNQDKLQLAVKLYAKEHSYASGVYERTITASEIEDVLNKTSLNIKALVHESIKCTIATSPVHNDYDYDPNSKTYSNANHPGHGGGGQVLTAFSKSSDFKNNNGQYSISYGYVFIIPGDTGGGDVPTYGKYYDAKSQTNVLHIFKSPDDEMMSSVEPAEQAKYFENNYGSFVDKLSKYTYTFEKIDGKISLVGFSVK